MKCIMETGTPGRGDLLQYSSPPPEGRDGMKQHNTPGEYDARLSTNAYYHHVTIH